MSRVYALLINLKSTLKSTLKGTLKSTLKGGKKMKWGLKSLRSRRKEKELKMYVEMKIMEARIQRLLDTLERRERNAA